MTLKREASAGKLYGTNHIILINNGILKTIEDIAISSRASIRADTASMEDNNGLNLDNHVLQEIFTLIDTDDSMTLDKQELLDAVHDNQQILELVHTSDILQPFLKPKAFEAALLDLETTHEGIVTFAEFRAFMLSLARSVQEEEGSNVVKTIAAQKKRATERLQNESAARLAQMEDKIARTLSKCALVVHILATNVSVCDLIVQNHTLSVLVALCRSSHEETLRSCAKTVSLLAQSVDAFNDRCRRRHGSDRTLSLPTDLQKFSC